MKNKKPNPQFKSLLSFIPTLALIALVGLGSACKGFFDNCTCETSIVSEISSPDGEMKAVVFRYHCETKSGRGGLCELNHDNVSILPKNTGLPADPSEGNVFSAYDISGGVKAQWTGSRELLITGDDCQRFLKPYNGVTLKCQK